MSAYDANKFQKLTPLKDYVLVSNMNFGENLTGSGIIIQSLDKKLEGVHPRWAQIYAVGPEQKDVKKGQYILVKHGRWTRGSLIEDTEGKKIIRRVDAADILLVSDEPMQDETLGNSL